MDAMKKPTAGINYDDDDDDDAVDDDGLPKPRTERGPLKMRLLDKSAWFEPFNLELVDCDGLLTQYCH